MLKLFSLLNLTILFLLNKEKKIRYDIYMKILIQILKDFSLGK